MGKGTEEPGTTDLASSKVLGSVRRSLDCLSQRLQRPLRAGSPEPRRLSRTLGLPVTLQRAH